MQYGAINQNLQITSKTEKRRKIRKDERVVGEIRKANSTKLVPQKDKQSFGKSVHPVNVVLKEIPTPEWISEGFMAFGIHHEDNILKAVYLDPYMNVTSNNYVEKINDVILLERQMDNFSFNARSSVMKVETSYETHEAFAYFPCYFNYEDHKQGREMYKNVIAKALMFFQLELICSAESYQDMVEEMMDEDEELENIKYYKDTLDEIVRDSLIEQEEDIRLNSINLDLIRDADYIFCYLYNSGFTNLANSFRKMVGILILCQSILKEDQIDITVQGNSGLVLTTSDFVLETISQEHDGGNPACTWYQYYEFDVSEMDIDLTLQKNRPQCSLFGFYATEFLQTLHNAYEKDHEIFNPKTNKRNSFL